MQNLYEFNTLCKRFKFVFPTFCYVIIVFCRRFENIKVNIIEILNDLFHITCYFISYAKNTAILICVLVCYMR